MKPKTKLQMELYNHVLNLKEVKIDGNKYFDNVGIKSTKFNKYFCTCCGNVTKTIKCEHCGKMLKINEHYQSVGLMKTYKKTVGVTKFETYKQFQVVRYFELTKEVRNKNVKYAYCEKIVMFCNEKEEFYFTTYPTQGFGYSWSSHLELRKGLYHDYYYSLPYKGKNKLIDDLKYFPLKFIKKPLPIIDLIEYNEPRIIEHLIKQGHDFITEYYHTRSNSDKRNILLAAKKKYIPCSWHTYHDYLKMGSKLVNFKIIKGYDNYPKDLKKNHDLFVRKLEKKEDSDLINECSEQNVKYKKSKEKYFNLDFNYHNYNFKVLKNLFEFKQEGKVMKNCVFSSEYYKQDNSLIVSVEKDHNKYATCQIYLKEKEIGQFYGQRNSELPDLNELKEIVQNNLLRMI